MLDAARLREQMKLKGLTQAELARRVGVTQQTIARLVSGETYGSRYLHLIARELGTTPAYLTRDTDDPDSHEPEARFSHEEAQWIEQLRGLTPDNRNAVMTLTRSLATSAASPTLQAPTMPFCSAPTETAGSIDMRLAR